MSSNSINNLTTGNAGTPGNLESQPLLKNEGSTTSKIQKLADSILVPAVCLGSYAIIVGVPLAVTISTGAAQNVIYGTGVLTGVLGAYAACCITACVGMALDNPCNNPER
jgi:hypothetical protein